MNEGIIDAIKQLTKEHVYDFKKVSDALNDLIASGKHPEWGPTTQSYTSDECRLAFSAVYKAAAEKKRASQPPKAKNRTPMRNVSKVIDTIETFADAVKFEEELVRESREKREEIFERVAKTFRDLGIENCGEGAPEVELPADVMYAINEQEKKRKEEKERMERIEQERKDRKEIEEARARLRSRFDEGSEDAEGIDPLAHLNQSPEAPAPMTQEELLYDAAPLLPINTILFSDEFEEALTSVERELEQAAAPKSDEVSELGEVLAFLDEEAQRNPSSSGDKFTAPDIDTPLQETQGPSSRVAPTPVNNSKDLSHHAEPLPSRLSGSDKARAIMLKKLHESGNGDMTLVARYTKEGRQELVGRQGQSFTSSSMGSSGEPQQPTSSSSSSQTNQGQKIRLEAMADANRDDSKTKVVGRMHYGEVKPNRPNGKGGTRLNIVEGDSDESDQEDDEEDDDDRYMRQRREQKSAAQAAMLKNQKEHEKVAHSKPRVTVCASEDVTDERDQHEEMNSAASADTSMLQATMPPQPPSKIEEQEVMRSSSNGCEDVDSNDENSDSHEDDNTLPSLSGIGRSRRDKASSAATRKERIKKSFRTLGNTKKDKEGE